MHVNVFDFSELLARSPKRHLEFIRVSAFSVGIYVLDSGATDLDWLRKRAGGTVNSRLNARLKAASDSYPTSDAICATE
jgi:hypothetical protein